MRSSLKPKLVLLGSIVLVFLGAIVSGNTFAQDDPFIYSIQLVDDTINPITAEYISQGIRAAEQDGAQCLVIKLDTPGGLLNSTRAIVKDILAAEVPVVVYISPGGSRAGSAGVFITYASHIAAMSPSTNIGAAHPVQLGQQKKQRDIWDGLKDLLEQAQKKKTADAPVKDKKPAQEKREETSTADEDPMSSKILQDTVAFIRSIAKKRNRNVDWAEKSVTKSSSITETEALDLGVIDLVASNDADLVRQLDGRQVELLNGPQTLQTKGAVIKPIAMALRQRFFNILANPNIAYILMMLGFYGLMYEVTHPGIGVPGILGTIFIILAFFSMQTLPTNYAGLALVILGLILFIAEAFVPGLGLLTLGGLVSLVLGSLLLFDSTNPSMQVSLSLILSFAGTTAAITIFLVRAVFKAHCLKAKGGQEGLIGSKGEVTRDIVPGQQGKVYVHGELWNAISDEELKTDDKVSVEEIDGMIIKVKKL